MFAGTRVDEFEERSKGATYQEIAARGGGIQSTVNRTRAASVDELVATGRRYAEWFLRGGTTTVEAKSGYGLSLEDELKILRAIKRLDQETPLRYVPTFLGAHSVPPEYRARRDEYISLIIDEMLPQVAQQKLAEFCDVFCEEKVFTTDESWKILSAARCHGLGLRMHADQLSLSGGAKLAAELGTVTADHLEHTDAEGISALKQAGVQPVLLPGSVYALGSSRYPAAREMIDAGLAVVLATDFNPGSSPTPSMPMILSLGSNTHEDDARGSDHRRHDQRRVQFESRRSTRLARARQDRRFRYSRLRRLSRACILLRHRARMAACLFRACDWSSQIDTDRKAGLKSVKSVPILNYRLTIFSSCLIIHATLERR